jgi:acid phosphatase class B
MSRLAVILSVSCILAVPAMSAVARGAQPPSQQPGATAKGATGGTPRTWR